MKEPTSHRILLVDDEPYVTEALKRILHKKGFDVFTAESADEALNLLAQEPVDIVVSDEKMPGLCGSEFLALVYQKYPETVRIILTGHADLEVALRAINIGQIYRFLIKPINELELEVTIRQAIQHKELLTKSSRLLTTVRQQQALLQELEKENPGITNVNRDSRGVIVLDESDFDPDDLIEKINAEINKFEVFSRGEKLMGSTVNKETYLG